MTTDVLSDQDVAGKMKAVCKRLGWKVGPPSVEFHYVHLKAQIEGFPSSYVSMAYGHYPNMGRITVNARTDHDSSIYRYGEKHLSISVSAVRSVDQIINEIKRRFVEPFLDIARKAEEIQKGRDQYQRSMESCLGRLKQEALEEGERLSAKFNLHLDPAWGTVQYGSDDLVTLDFHSVPTEKAERILSILREPTVVIEEESHGA